MLRCLVEVREIVEITEVGNDSTIQRVKLVEVRDRDVTEFDGAIQFIPTGFIEVSFKKDNTCDLLRIGERVLVDIATRPCRPAI